MAVYGILQVKEMIPVTKSKNPMKNLRGRIEFTHNESYDRQDDASLANPWDRMLQHDKRWNHHGTRRLLKVDFLTVLVLLGVGALIIGAVLLMR